MLFSNLDYFYGPYLFNLQMYTHIYKFNQLPILFYLKQLSAVVFGKQECSDMYMYIFKNEGVLVKVSMCLCI